MQRFRLKNFRHLILLPALALQFFSGQAFAQLTIGQAGEGVSVNWSSTNATLHAAADPFGPWTVLSNAFSPYVVLSANAPQMFFRLDSGLANNPPPSADGGAYSLTHDQSLFVNPPGALTNAQSFTGGTLTATLVSTTVNGALSLFSDGSFSYTPNAGFTGGDSFAYTASDDFGTSAPAMVLILVTNTAPISQNDFYAVPVGANLAVPAPGVLANDFDADGDALSATLLANPTNGSVIFNPDGSFVYEANTNAAGMDSFTYLANDGLVNGNIATVTITMHPLNAAPSAMASSYAVAHDQVLDVSAPGVLSGASDPDSDAFSASVTSPPANGSVTLFVDGSFEYVPNAGYAGPDSFSFVAGDGLAVSAPVTVSISVTNSPPVALSDNFLIPPNTMLSVPASGVLVNDTDADGDDLTAQLVTLPANGLLVLNTNGSFTYTPNINFIGTDYFNYAANDGLTNSQPAMVAIVVTNQPPEANPDVYGVHFGMTVAVTAPGVLLNDIDPFGGVLTAVLNSPPQNGTLALNPDGSFTYTPTAGFAGTDIFSYSASNAYAVSAPTLVSLNVHTANVAPLSATAQYVTFPNETLTVDGQASVLLEDQDADGDVLTAQLLTGPANGTLSFNNDGTFTYTPNTNFVGVDLFTYLPSDGLVSGPPAVVEIIVTNQPPVSLPDDYTMHANDDLTVAPPGVLANDGDPDYDLITATLVSAPANGTLALDSDGSFDYTPNANFVGVDTFVYVASDGIAFSPLTTVTITVTDSPPVTAEDDYAMSENTSLTNAAPGVLENDYDPEDDLMTASLASGPAHGALTFNVDGSFVYTPNSNFIGLDEFYYIASDGLFTSTNTLVTILVTNPATQFARPAATSGSPLLTLNSVYFLDPSGTNYFPLGLSGVYRQLLPDPTTSKPVTKPFDRPEWKSGQKTQSPFIYKRASTMLVQPRFEGKNIPDGATITMQGDVYPGGLPAALESLKPGDAYPDNVNPAPDFIFSPKELVKSSGAYLPVTNVDIVNPPANKSVKMDPYHVMIAEAALPNRVTKYGNFGIAWHYNIAQGKTAGAETFAGASVNTLYSIYDVPPIVYKSPTSSLTSANPDYFVTVVDYGCRAGTALGDDPDPRKLIKEIFKLAFGDGKPANTKTVAGKPLAYYRSWDFTAHANFHYVAALLGATDGECDTWARFFAAMLNAQGIEVGNHAGLQSVANDTKFFLVKKWQFPNNGANPGVNTTSLKGPNIGTPAFGPINGKYAFAFNKPTAVPDELGLPGQNTDDPLSIFDSHVVVRVDDTDAANNSFSTFYDPSYGVIYASIDDVQKKAIAGFSVYEPPKKAGAPYTYNLRPAGQKLEMAERFFKPDLRFTVQPKNVAPNTAFSVSVSVVDVNGNLLANIPCTINLAVANNNAPGMPVFASVAAAQGVATFNNLKLPAGTAYTLAAWTIFGSTPDTDKYSRLLFSGMFDVK